VTSAFESLAQTGISTNLLSSTCFNGIGDPVQLDLETLISMPRLVMEPKIESTGKNDLEGSKIIN
jgi:hypothetical protein